MSTDPALRAGHGRWSPIQKPAAGVLWVTDGGVVGFDPMPDVDAAPVEAVLAAAADAGRDGGEAFDMLTALVGTTVSVGDVGHWRPDSGRTPRAPEVEAGVAPAVIQAVIAGGGS